MLLELISILKLIVIGAFVLLMVLIAIGTFLGIKFLGLLREFLNVYREDVNSRIRFRRGFLDLITIPIRLLTFPVRLILRLLRTRV